MKKWLVVVPDEQYNWLKTVARQAKETGLKITGSDVVRTALEKAQKDKELLTSLKESKIRERVLRLESQKAALEVQIQTIKKAKAAIEE